ncbi:MAG TPA: hypothetical protein VFW63_12280 [Acidimicrobiales bacterium]|nr:hypothetical protein [Acidimicrobiales bacterium]
MARCEVCGNDYDKAFEVVAAGAHHTFDSFECAIHLLAPICEHCGCRIVGHGTEVAGRFYCCAHCANAAEDGRAVVDRVDPTP